MPLYARCDPTGCPTYAEFAISLPRPMVSRGAPAPLLPGRRRRAARQLCVSTGHVGAAQLPPQTRRLPSDGTIRNIQDSACDPASRPLPDYPPLASFRSHLIPLPFVTVPSSCPPRGRAHAADWLGPAVTSAHTHAAQTKTLRNSQTSRRA